MASNQYTDGDGNSYYKTQVTVWVPVSLVEHIQNATGWGEKRALADALNTWNHYRDAGGVNRVWVQDGDDSTWAGIHRLTDDERALAWKDESGSPIDLGHSARSFSWNMRKPYG